jgi:hypothetical protein
MKTNYDQGTLPPASAVVAGSLSKRQRPLMSTTRCIAHLALGAAVVLGGAAQGAIVNIDLSGASSGATINGGGADFAQIFAGQSVAANTGISGTPSAPLTLQGAGNILVAFFNPGVSPAANSLLSQPDNQGPLSVLLDSNADSFGWTMGSSNSGSTVTVDFFDLAGNVVGTQTVNMGADYQNYLLTGLNTYRGLTFYNNNDPSGVRFQNMFYNALDNNGVPEPATLALVAFGLAGAAGLRRRRAA